MPNFLSRHPWSILLFLFAALYLVDLSIARDLWVQDEARYGEVVCEMLADGQWLIPHLNGHPYPDKPPLYFWMVAVLGMVVGHHELAFRLVSVVSTLVAAMGVWRVAKRLSDETAAYWSTAIFLSCLITLVVGHIMRMDMLLTAAAVWAWDAILRRQHGGDVRWLTAFWALTALTVAIKGPIGLLFTLLPALVWLVWEDWRKAMQLLRPDIGLAALVALISAWIGAVVLAGQAGYLSSIWHEQLVGRAVQSWSHREPFWFYLMLLPFLLMPWTALVLRGMYVIKPGHTSRTLISFIVPPLIALSLVSGKLFIYLQPMIPGLAIWGGLAAAAMLRQERVSAWISWPPVVFFLLLALGSGWGIGHRQEISPQWFGVLTAGFAILTILAVVLGRSSGRIWLSGWLVGSAGFNAMLAGVLVVALNPAYSARALGNYVAGLASPEVGVVNTTRGILNAYAGQKFTELLSSEVLDWTRTHPDGVLVMHDSDFIRIFGAGAKCSVNEPFRVEFKDYRVLRNCTG